MSIGTAGAGGALTGDASGLGGFFAALVSGAAPGLPTGTLPATPSVPTVPTTTGAPVGAGMISVLLGGPTVTTPSVVIGDANANAGGDPANVLVTMQVDLQTNEAQAQVKLGDAQPLTVTGDAETVKDFIEQVQAIYQKIIVEGKLTIGQLKDSKELAGALTKLGMSADDAAGVAERIQTMLKLLEQQQKVDDATAGSLAAMMLAVMGQGTQQQPVAGEAQAAPQLGLQIISVEQTPATTGASAVANSWQVRASGDVTRDLLGLNAAPKDKVADAAPDAGKMRQIEVQVAQDGQASVGVAMPDVKPQHTAAPKVQIDAQKSDSAQVAAAVTSTGAAVKVAAQEVIEAPKGETYYKLQADKNGVETLDAVKPASDVRDAAINLAQTNSQPTPAVAAAAVATGTDPSFAARVAQIHDMVDKAEVGKQVALQIQPLLAQGGGTVRMNLHPKDLGQVTVELQVVDGKVHGNIAATDPVVVEQLARELHNLRHGLADAGLKLGDQGINLMLSNQGQQEPNGQGSGGNRNPTPQGPVAGAEADGASLAVNLATWVSPDRVLDVNV